MDCRSIVSVSYLNVNRTVEMKMRRVRCDILAHRLLTAGWVEKLLSSDVSQEGSWTRSAFDALFGFRCWSATEQKQSLLISQTPPVTLNLLSSSSRNSVFQSYMTSHHDPPSSDTLSTSAVSQGNTGTFLIKQWLLHFLMLSDLSEACGPGSSFYPLINRRICWPHCLFLSSRLTN